MMEHNCDKYGQMIEYRNNRWEYSESSLPVGIKFCPFCGEKLPVKYKDGFYELAGRSTRNRYIYRKYNGFWYLPHIESLTMTKCSDSEVEKYYLIIRRIELEEKP